MTYMSCKDGRDSSFELFAETHWNGSVVRLYRTNGGATTDFGVVIRQERRLMPGLFWVRSLDDFYHCYSLDVSATSQGVRVQDPHSDCREFPVTPQDYRLRPYVYF